MVVCCRWEEYKQGQVQLYRLYGAYYLQPPNESDIRDYLHRLNQQDLWQKIATNEQMRELAQKPLFLNLMLTAFQGKLIVNEEQLFANYIEEQLNRPFNLQKYPQAEQGKLPYSHEDTKKWLTYLAGQLEADKLTVFLIEKIQSYWLNNRSSRLIFKIIFGSFLGLVFTTFLFLLFLLVPHFPSPMSNSINHLIGGSFLGIIFGLSWTFKEYKIRNQAFKLTMKGFLKGVVHGLFNGIAFQLIGTITYNLSYKFQFAMPFFMEIYQ